jgi:hypothetical protein
MFLLALLNGLLAQSVVSGSESQSSQARRGAAKKIAHLNVMM